VKIIDGKNAILGRLASYVAKESLKGEEMIILNCEHIVITGNKKNIKEGFEKKRGRVGSGQKGPKYSMTNEKIVKRVIRGMLPDHRKGRGKMSYKKIKCYAGVPEKFKEFKMTESGKKKKNKFSKLREFTK